MMAVMFLQATAVTMANLIEHPSILGLLYFQVTFSRDWLAGSGKRSAGVSAIDSTAVIHMPTPRIAVQMLVEYLATQLSVSSREKNVL